MASVPLPSVSADRLAHVLEEAGWQKVGGRQNVYSRFAPPGSESDIRGSLVVPLDVSAPEYEELMDAALSVLSSPQYRDMWQRTIAPRLATGNSDAFRFRKEIAAPSGLIAWKQGEALIESARLALVAGAKALIEPGRRYYGSVHGQFAGRYLDTVLMGQTASGSYVVTAYAPANVNVPLKSSRSENRGIEGTDSVSARQVADAIVTAIDATVEAMSHHRSTGSLSGFDEGVIQGISFEMVSALRNLSKDADEADITVEWDVAEPTDKRPRVFHFDGSDAAILDAVASRFVAAKPEKRVSLVGRVHLLTKKQAGGPGVFGMATVSGQPRKVRVRLAVADDYHEAVRAHDQDLVVRVAGGLTREGQVSWLYNARITEVLGNYGQMVGWPEQRTSSGLQSNLFDAF